MNRTVEPLQRGQTAPNVELPATDGRTWTLAEACGPNGVVVAFICNHCPYVLAVIDRLVAEARALREIGVGFVAVCSNDAVAYPDDSFERMQEFARRHRFDFPYLHDETQQMARAYGAACTPDFFGLDARRVLQYRGRLDAAGRGPATPGMRRELFEAMQQVAAQGSAPQEQHASVGCSIKWKSVV